MICWNHHIILFLLKNILIYKSFLSVMQNKDTSFLKYPTYSKLYCWLIVL